MKFLKKHEFKRNDITVCLDYTKWYWYIIELEKMTPQKNKKQSLKN